MLAAVPLVTGATECEQATPAPVCGLECGAGEQIVCGHMCAGVGRLNDDCDPDPCSEKGLCEDGLACQYTAFGYLCRPAETLWQTCSDPGGGPDDDECANNLFCRENDVCPDYPYGFQCRAASRP